MKIKNKWMLAGIAAVVVVVGVAAFMFFRGGGGDELDIPTTAEEDVVEMQASDIGLTLTPINSGREVEMTVTNLEKVVSIEGSLEYEALESGEMVSRGALVSISEEEVSEAKSGSGEITREITIGTCSSGTCKYDQGVEEVTAQLRINLTTGEVGAITEKVSIE